MAGELPDKVAVAVINRLDMRKAVKKRRKSSKQAVAPMETAPQQANTRKPPTGLKSFYPLQKDAGDLDVAGGADHSGGGAMLPRSQDDSAQDDGDDRTSDTGSEDSTQEEMPGLMAENVNNLQWYFAHAILTTWDEQTRDAVYTWLQEHIRQIHEFQSRM